MKCIYITQRLHQTQQDPYEWFLHMWWVGFLLGISQLYKVGFGWKTLQPNRAHPMHTPNYDFLRLGLANQSSGEWWGVYFYVLEYLRSKETFYVIEFKFKSVIMLLKNGINEDLRLLMKLLKKSWICRSWYLAWYLSIHQKLMNSVLSSTPLNLLSFEKTKCKVLFSANDDLDFWEFVH